MVTPTVISTFAGCGGSSLGYQLAGFNELLAVEWDDGAVQVFRDNFPNVPVYHGDIAKLTGTECMRLAKTEKGQLDVLDGSPPCQGFSVAGARRFNDPRNSLFKDYVRLLSEMNPKVFVMENVTGLVKGVMKQAYLQIVAALRDCGYRVKGQVLNAMYFGVPQNRRRVIIIGVRNDLSTFPSHPKPMSTPKSAKGSLQGLVDDPEEIERLLVAGGKYAAYKHYAKIPIGSNQQDVIEGISGFSNVKFDPNKPAKTIMRTDGVVGAYGALHWSEKRRFTVAEFKRFHSFPDGFQFNCGYKAVGYIGNSVPPNLMKAIAEHIKTTLLQGVN